MDLEVGISYGEDLEAVKQITLDAVSAIPGLAPNEKTGFYYESFGESSINFSIRLWASTPDQPDYLRVRSEAITKIKAAYDKAGIQIPFPIRTIQFEKSGT